jgi:hypothetical protein
MTVRSIGATLIPRHRGPVSDIDTVVDSLKALDPERRIREADVARTSRFCNGLAPYGGGSERVKGDLLRALVGTPSNQRVRYRKNRGGVSGLATAVVGVGH